MRLLCISFRKLSNELSSPVYVYGLFIMTHSYVPVNKNAPSYNHMTIYKYTFCIISDHTCCVYTKHAYSDDHILYSKYIYLYNIFGNLNSRCAKFSSIKPYINNQYASIYIPEYNNK